MTLKRLFPPSYLSSMSGCLLTFLFILFFALGTYGQESGAPNVLSQVINAHVGPRPLLSAVLKGTVAFGGAASEKPVAITLAAFSQRSSEIDVDAPTGNQREIRIGTGIFPSRRWTGSDGIEHKASQADLKLPHPAWFFPSFVLLSGIGSPDYWASDLGTTVWEGNTVSHIAVWQRFPRGQSLAASAGNRATTETDFYLDPMTFLPRSMTFHVKVDPQNPNELILPASPSSGDVVVQVNYSDYRTIQDRQIPFHIQLVEGTSTVMDIQISSVAFDGNDISTAIN
jgi:hypothetical protein